MFVVLGGLEVAGLGRGRVVMVATTAIFFVLYGVMLILAARGLARLNSAWRGPAVMAQLIQVLVARSFWGGETKWVALLLVLLAGTIIGGIFAPLSTRSLAAPDD
jgi:hypothetical protein